MLEFIFLFILASVMSVLLWYQSFQEFTILQYEYKPSMKLPDEKVPIVIRGVPKEWSSVWGSQYAKLSALPILLEEGRRTTLREYTNSGSLFKLHPLTTTELANRFHLTSKFKDSMTFLSKMWYLPITTLTSPCRLSIIPSKKQIGLQRTLAERTVLTVHEGETTVWLARELISSRDILTILNKNPWTLKSSDTPFIHDLQYVEIILRAGNSIIFPPRSLYGLSNPSETNPTYFSTIELHSPLSLFIISISGSSSSSTTAGSTTAGSKQPNRIIK
jgi:hypothetical protein